MPHDSPGVDPQSPHLPPPSPHPRLPPSPQIMQMLAQGLSAKAAEKAAAAIKPTTAKALPQLVKNGAKPL